MKAYKVFSRLLIIFGLLSWAIFQLTKDKFRWPAFITNNIFNIFLGSVITGYVLLFIYYLRTKDTKKSKELAIVAVVIAAFFGLVHLIT